MPLTSPPHHVIALRSKTECPSGMVLCARAHTKKTMNFVSNCPLRNIELCIFKPIPVCGSFRPFQSSNPIISCSCICSSPHGHWILPVPFMLLISCPEFAFTKSPEGGTHTKCLLHFESGAQSKDALLTISWGNHLKWMKPMENHLN